MKIQIDHDKCCWKDGKCSSCSCDCEDECAGCAESCPVQAITREKTVIINDELCIGCGACIVSCKHNALQLL